MPSLFIRHCYKLKRPLNFVISQKNLHFGNGAMGVPSGPSRNSRNVHFVCNRAVRWLCDGCAAAGKTDGVPSTEGGGG